jgi:hypothetical protein
MGGPWREERGGRRERRERREERGERESSLFERGLSLWLAEELQTWSPLSKA